MTSEFIRVLARVRPSRHDNDESALSLDGDRGIALNTNDRDAKSFTFDGVFGSDSSQQDVWEGMGRHVVDGVLSGLNGTIFAYGQTGSGKTYTMIGPSLAADVQSHPNRGIIPRCLEHLFSSLETRVSQVDNVSFSVSCMFIECYNEGLTDLLSPIGQTVAIRGDENKMVFQGATSETVTSALEAIKLLKVGWENRQIAETNMNKESSRSHAIFIIDVTMEETKNGLISRCDARLNLIDLAGSERQGSTGCTGIRLIEAGKINKSLSTLGRVIRTLSIPACNLKHVPYRDSRLTFMIKDSLGGNSRTAVVVNLHPDREFLAESLSTLQFAEMCGKVRNSTSVNHRISGASMEALKEEVLRLKEQLDMCKAAAEEDAAKRLSKVVDECSQWKTRAMDSQQKFASLQIELECRSRLAQKKEFSEKKMEAIEELKTMVASRYNESTMLATYDKQALVDEIDMLRTQLYGKKEECGEYERRLRQELEQKLASPMNVSNRRYTENSPRMDHTLEVSKSFVLNEIVSPEFSKDVQDLQVINSQALQDMNMRNTELEKEVVEQRALLGKLRDQFEEKAQEHMWEVSGYIDKSSAAEREVSDLQKRLSDLKQHNDTLEESRRILETRLNELTVQRDTCKAEVAQALKERDEATEERERLANEKEEVEARMEASQKVNLDVSLVSAVPKRDQEVQVGGDNDVQMERLLELCHEQRTRLAVLECENKSLTESVKDLETLKEERMVVIDDMQLKIMKAVEQKMDISQQLSKEKKKWRDDKDYYKRKLKESKARERQLQERLDYGTPKQYAGDNDAKFSDRVNQMRQQFHDGPLSSPIEMEEISPMFASSMFMMLDNWKEDEEKIAKARAARNKHKK